jgi:hypothetical protein
MSEVLKWTLAGLALAPAAWSFCGFYVAQEPGSLFNKSSQVVLARQGDHTVLRDGMSAVYLEYAWPLAQGCDPCSGSSLTPGEYASLGWESRTRQGFLTRLHVRYDAAHFPEDLVFQETQDRQAWQARYVVHRRYDGDTSCAEGRRYERALLERQDQEVSALARLTGWDPARIWSFVPEAR